MLDALLAKMQEQAVAARAWLEPVPAATREALADLIADGDRAQLADPSFRRELASWVHHNHSAAEDGMRAYGFGVPGLLSRLGPFVICTFDNGNRQSAKDRALASQPLSWSCSAPTATQPGTGSPPGRHSPTSC